jgi:tetratricopeptide (TPR) repeat protein
VVNNRGARVKTRLGLYYRGFITLKKRNAEEALALLAEAVRARPPIYNIDAFEDCLANAYLELGRFDEAIAEYQRILRLNPNYPLARFHLAEAYRAKGLTSEAALEYRNFLETWKDADADIPEIAAARKFLE